MTDVHVTEETGDRLVVVREVALERNVVNELHTRDLASWPESPQDRRMWALSAVLQAPGLKFRADLLDETFAEAQRIVDWINGE